LGDVRVSITLADTNVLVIDSYSTDYKTINYSLNKLYFTVNTINLSPEWYQAQAMFLEKGGILQRKCSLWWAFQGSVVQGTKQPLTQVALAPTAVSGMYQEPILPSGNPHSNCQLLFGIAVRGFVKWDYAHSSGQHPSMVG
jgi:hypothetical protein